MVKDILTGAVAIISLCFGRHLCQEANKVIHGGTPKDPVSFRALSRYPSGDYGKHWDKKDVPEMVRVFGSFLIIAGSIGIIQTLWRFIEFWRHHGAGP